MIHISVLQYKYTLVNRNKINFTYKINKAVCNPPISVRGDQSLHCPYEETLGPYLPIDRPLLPPSPTPPTHPPAPETVAHFFAFCLKGYWFDSFSNTSHPLSLYYTNAILFLVVPRPHQTDADLCLFLFIPGRACHFCFWSRTCHFLVVFLSCLGLIISELIRVSPLGTPVVLFGIMRFLPCRGLIISLYVPGYEVIQHDRSDVRTPFENLKNIDFENLKN